MTAQNILHDASGTTEFYAVLPDRAENYVRTIIAFANTQVGRLVVGVDDKTGQVTGIEETEKSVFEIMDSIAHAADDLCSPRIVPIIEPQTLEGRTVVVVTVTPGPDRPYYLKAKGRDNGTYFRSAGTTRPASLNKIIEPEL